MFDVRTDILRNSSGAYWEFQDDLEAISRELWDVQDNLSGFSDMSNVLVALENVSRDSRNIARSCESIADALQSVSDRYEDTEQEICDRDDRTQTSVSWQNVSMTPEVSAEVSNLISRLLH